MKKNVFVWQIIVLLTIVGIRLWDVLYGPNDVAGVSFTFFMTLVLGALFQRFLQYRKGHAGAFVYWFLVDLCFSVFAVWAITNMGLIPIL